MFAVTGYAGRRGLGQDNTEPVQTIPIPTDPFSNIAAAFSSFGIGEWAVIIGGAIILFSVLYTGSVATSRVRGGMRKRKARRSKRAKLEQQLRDL